MLAPLLLSTGQTSNNRVVVRKHAADDTTFVSVTNSGFRGDADTVVTQTISSTEGFTLVLAGLKALLEHNIRLNLVGDRFPAGIEEG